MLDIHFFTSIQKKQQQQQKKQYNDWLQGTPVMAALPMNQT